MGIVLTTELFCSACGGHFPAKLQGNIDRARELRQTAIASGWVRRADKGMDLCPACAGQEPVGGYHCQTCGRHKHLNAADTWYCPWCESTPPARAGGENVNNPGNYSIERALS